jgi:hypothetical protein
MLHTLLNKKFGRNYLMGFIMSLCMPFLFAIRNVSEGGAGKTDAEKEKEALFAEIDTRIKSVIADSGKENVKKADVDKEIASINELIKGLTDKQIKELKDTVDKQNDLLRKMENASVEQGKEITLLKSGSTPAHKMTFVDAVKSSILKFKDKCLEEITDTNGTRLSLLKYFQDGNKMTPEFVIDKAVDMLESNIVQNYVGQIRLSELATGVYGTPITFYPHVLDYFPQRNISKPNLSMLVTYSYSDGAGTKTEGSAGTASSFLLKTVSFPSFFIDTYIPLSDETLDDLDEVLSEINRIAPSKIKDKLDEKIYADAGNDSTDIRGLFVNTYKCTDFVASTYENSVEGANYVDLIEAMVASCETNKYQPDTVGLNPVDVRSKFNSLKNQLDDSVRDNRLVFVNGNLVSVCGLRVVKSAAITANTCFVGAINSVALLGIRKAMTMEIGLNGSDFTERQKTARIGMRVAFGVGDPLGVIYCSDMATDKETIKLTTV